MPLVAPLNIAALSIWGIALVYINHYRTVGLDSASRHGVSTW